MKVKGRHCKDAVLVKVLYLKKKKGYILKEGFTELAYTLLVGCPNMAIHILERLRTS